MKNRNIYIILGLIIFILGFAFYWFEFRPTQIRKSCFNTSLDFSNDYQNEFYINCVKGNGIRP